MKSVQNWQHWQLIKTYRYMSQHPPMTYSGIFLPSAIFHIGKYWNTGLYLIKYIQKLNLNLRRKVKTLYLPGRTKEVEYDWCQCIHCGYYHVLRWKCLRLSFGQGIYYWKMWLDTKLRSPYKRTHELSYWGHDTKGGYHYGKIKKHITHSPGWVY